MSPAYVSAGLRRRVQQRAKHRCEYCLLSEQDAFLSHEPDHVISEKHGGVTSDDNLAWSCFDCNRFKGSDIAARDPLTDQLVPLFNPRTEQWSVHFRIQEGRICGLTPVGRATERLLKLNLSNRVEVRRILTQLGSYLPDP